MRFECLPMSLAQRIDLPATQRHAALPDLQPLLNRTADNRSLNPVPLRDFGHPFRIRRGEQDPRRSFVETEHLRSKVAVEIHLRADLARSETGFGERYG